MAYVNSRVAAIALGMAWLLGGAPARAWDDEGHMVVAAIAWGGLDPVHRARIGELLKHNPDYAHWIEGVIPGDRDRMAFVMASTWPDAIKHNPRYLSDGQTPAIADPAAGQNVGYADHRMHRYWHFIDMPLSTDGSPVSPPPTPNVRTQIELFVAAIGNREVSEDIKSYDLVWLEHLVGDVHQPLHATTRFSRELPDGDRGGNLVQCPQQCPLGELHAYWDDLLDADSRDLSPQALAAAAVALAAELPIAPASQASQLDDAVWIRESQRAAREFVYAPPVGPGAGPYELDEHYQQAARAEARRRVALAGARLARLLEAVLTIQQPNR